MSYAAPSAFARSTAGLLKLTGTAITSSTSLVLPANCYIQQVFVKETAGFAITGGLKFGTTAGATDIVVALGVSANSLNFVLDAALLKRWFSTSISQTIYIDAVTLWAGASVNITIVYGQLT